MSAWSGQRWLAAGARAALLHSGHSEHRTCTPCGFRALWRLLVHRCLAHQGRPCAESAVVDAWQALFTCAPSTYALHAQAVAALLPLAKFLSEHWLNCAVGSEPTSKFRSWGCRLQALLPSGIGVAVGDRSPSLPDLSFKRDELGMTFRSFSHTECIALVCRHVCVTKVDAAPGHWRR